MPLNPRSTLHATAVHEAAHVAADLALGLGCEDAHIIPDGSGLRGEATTSAAVERWDNPDQGFSDEKWRRVMVAIMAGYRAQARWTGRNYEQLSNGSTDEEKLLELMLRLDSRWIVDPKDGPVQTIPPAAFGRLLRRTDRLLDRHWPFILRVAERLVIQRRLRGDQALAMFRRWMLEG